MASARSRIRRSWTSSPRARWCSTRARRATSCSASFPPTRSIRCQRYATAGVKVTLGSDDPPYFGATIEGEYELCAERMGFGEDDLRDVTRTAIEAAFCDEGLRDELRRRARV